jgi:hypothetical protein
MYKAENGKESHSLTKPLSNVSQKPAPPLQEINSKFSNPPSKWLKEKKDNQNNKVFHDFYKLINSNQTKKNNSIQNNTQNTNTLNSENPKKNSISSGDWKMPLTKYLDSKKKREKLLESIEKNKKRVMKKKTAHGRDEDVDSSKRNPKLTLFNLCIVDKCLSVSNRNNANTNHSASKEEPIIHQNQSQSHTQNSAILQKSKLCYKSNQSISKNVSVTQGQQNVSQYDCDTRNKWANNLRRKYKSERQKQIKQQETKTLINQNNNINSSAFMNRSSSVNKTPPSLNLTFSIAASSNENFTRKIIPNQKNDVANRIFYPPNYFKRAKSAYGKERKLNDVLKEGNKDHLTKINQMFEFIYKTGPDEMQESKREKESSNNSNQKSLNSYSLYRIKNQQPIKSFGHEGLLINQITKSPQKEKKHSNDGLGNVSNIPAVPYAKGNAIHSYHSSISRGDTLKESPIFEYYIQKLNTKNLSSKNTSYPKSPFNKTNKTANSENEENEESKNSNAGTKKNQILFSGYSQSSEERSRGNVKTNKFKQEETKKSRLEVTIQAPPNQHFDCEEESDLSSYDSEKSQKEISIKDITQLLEEDEQKTNEDNIVQSPKTKKTKNGKLNKFNKLNKSKQFGESSERIHSLKNKKGSQSLNKFKGKLFKEDSEIWNFLEENEKPNLDEKMKIFSNSLLANKMDSTKQDVIKQIKSGRKITRNFTKIKVIPKNQGYYSRNNLETRRYQLQDQILKFIKNNQRRSSQKITKSSNSYNSYNQTNSNTIRPNNKSSSFLSTNTTNTIPHPNPIPLNTNLPTTHYSTSNTSSQPTHPDSHPINLNLNLNLNLHLSNPSSYTAHPNQTQNQNSHSSPTHKTPHYTFSYIQNPPHPKTHSDSYKPNIQPFKTRNHFSYSHTQAHCNPHNNQKTQNQNNRNNRNYRNCENSINLENDKNGENSENKYIGSVNNRIINWNKSGVTCSERRIAGNRNRGSRKRIEMSGLNEDCGNEIGGSGVKLGRSVGVGDFSVESKLLRGKSAGGRKSGRIEPSESYYQSRSNYYQTSLQSIRHQPLPFKGLLTINSLSIPK